MDKDVDYIIVGGGFAGLFFAHQLLKNQKSFILYSGATRGASHVSAGIINPVVLKKFTTFWLAREQIQFLNETMIEIAEYLGENYLLNENIHRIFHDDGEIKLWQLKAESAELSPFLSNIFEKLEVVENPFGTGSVIDSARIDVDGFFKNFTQFLKDNQQLIAEDFDYKELSNNHYKDISFEKIVFCEGMGVRANPYFDFIPLIPNKGHHLLVKLSQDIPHNYIIKKKHFLFRVTQKIYYYGGTYDPLEKGNDIEQEKVAELVAGLESIYQFPYEIVAVNFGFRPTVKDRRPIIGTHPEQTNFFIFNGLGARGILNGCYFSRILFNFIEYDQPLMKEVDVRRFSK